MDIPMREYCPRSKYGLHREDIIKKVVSVEDELNHNFIPSEIPKFVKKDPVKITPAFIVGFAGNMIRYVLP